MKAVLILLAVLGTVCAAPSLRVELAADIPEFNPFLDFLHGFLDGLNVKGDINKILECVKGGEGVIEKIIEALNYLIHIDIRHLDDIIKGVMMLVDAVKDIYKIIEPCSKSFEEIMRIIENIISTNIMKIVWRIITNAPQFIHDIQDAIHSFAIGDFYKAGVDIGDIIYRLFIAHTEKADPAFDFIKGFLEGINEKGDINKILECIHDLEPAILEIIKAFELISHFNLHDLIEGVKLLIKGVKDIVNSLRPCSEGFEQLKKLAKALINIDIAKIVSKIFSNPAIYIQIVMRTIQAFSDGDFYKVGRGVGEIVFRLLLEDTLEFNFDDFVQLIEGFLKGAGHDTKFTDIRNCLEKIPEIYQDILEAIKYLKEIDLKHLDKLVDALIKVFEAMKKVLVAVKPCSKAPNDIDEMIKKIMDLDANKLLQRITANMVQIMADCMALLTSLQNGKYFDAGRALGDIFYLIAFKY